MPSRSLPRRLLRIWLSDPAKPASVKVKVRALKKLKGAAL